MFLANMPLTMSKVVLIIHTICFILVTIIFTIVAGDESSSVHSNNTNYLGRTKRSPLDRSTSLWREMPHHLRIRVRFPTGEEMELNWIKRKEYLANKYLPIITPADYLNPDVMNDVGEFIVYHDPLEYSAVVYFEKFHTMFGVIGMNYYVSDLPFEIAAKCRDQKTVGEPWIKRRVYTPTHNLPQLSVASIQELLSPSGDGKDKGMKRPSDSDSGSSAKHHRIERDLEQMRYESVMNTNISETINIRKRRFYSGKEQYYIEFLVFVTRDVADIFKELWDENHYIEWIARYFIIYFNTLDMVFQKLPIAGIDLHLNIAKIVIEYEKGTLGPISNSHVSDELPHFLKIHQHEYPPDSFDHIFIFTNQPIMENSMPVHGITKQYGDLHEARKMGQFYESVPITLLGFENDYIVGVHEISKALKIEIDSRFEAECSSIMQEGSSKCDDCLRWSDRSIKQFEEFFSNNRHSCFFLNLPRSLRPPGPSVLLSPHQQCRCYGYDSYITMVGKSERRVRARVGTSECEVPLPCRNIIEGQPVIEGTVVPFDGTPCGKTKSACWNRKCTRIDKEQRKNPPVCNAPHPVIEVDD